MKILYFEPGYGGHRDNYYKYYLNTLIKLSRNANEIGLCASQEFNVSGLDKRIKIYRIPAPKYKDKLNIVMRCYNYMRKLMFSINIAHKYNYSIFHFMDIDSFKISTILILLFVPTNFNMFVTLHWACMPLSTKPILKRVFMYLDSFALKLILNKTKAIFVHGEAIKIYITKHLLLKVSDKVVSVPYPIKYFTNDISKEKARKILNLPENSKILLAFGGTRFEKGVNLLLDAAEKIPLSNNFKILIAGQAEFFNKKYFINRMSTNTILKNRLILRLMYIEGRNIDLYFNAIDVLVLPYRNIYMGQSGPLNLAIMYNKPIIAADVLQIGYDMKKYNLGLTFIPENSQSLCTAIQKYLSNQYYYQSMSTIGRKKYIKINQIENMVRLILERYQFMN